MTRITLEEARRWCHKAHGEQKYGDHPYSYHLDAVEAVAVRFGFADDETRMACQSHDVGEDTSKSSDDMRQAGFPEPVVETTEAITDQPGATRAERKARTLPRIARVRRAVIVKLADRIANVEENIKTANRSQFRKYKNEQHALDSHLRDRSETAVEPMWLHLESLFAREAEWFLETPATAKQGS